MAGGERSEAVRFGGVNPIFRVADLAASLDYYVRVLGFQIEWEFTGVIASVARDKVAIFLSQGDQGNPGAWVWIGVGDVAQVHEEFAGRGAIIRQPPTNLPWALEMQVADPDGNVLRIGSEPLPNRPIGEWLDMYGQSWARTRDGRWIQKS